MSIRNNGGKLRYIPNRGPKFQPCHDYYFSYLHRIKTCKECQHRLAVSRGEKDVSRKSL